MNSRQPAASSPWPPVVVAGLCLLTGAVVLGGFLGAWWAYGRDQTPTEADRRRLVTGELLRRYLDGFVLQKSSESIAKRRFPDGRQELTYEYLHQTEEGAITVRSRLWELPSRALARRRFAEMGRGDAVAGVEFVAAEQQFNLGEASTFGELQRNGEAVGRRFICWRGEEVFLVEIEGRQFEDLEPLAEAIREALEEGERQQAEEEDADF